MERAVIVRAVGYDDRQAERLVPGADQMIRSRLRSRIGRRRRVRRLFGEERAVERQVAEDFIRRNMMEAERGRAFARQFPPIGESGVEQPKAADDIRLDEIGRPVDGTVDMRLGRQMHDPRDAFLAQQSRHQILVTDVALHETVVQMVFDLPQRVQVSCIGEPVQVDHAICRVGNKVPAQAMTR